MGITSMFRRPKNPKPQALPEATPTPTIDQASQNAEEQLRLRRRKGRASFMLRRDGDMAQPNVGTKTLTGS